MRKVVLGIAGGAAVLLWLAFTVRGVTLGWQGLGVAAADFEAWLYTWTAFPVLLALSVAVLLAWVGARLLRWLPARTWMERLAELHEEGVTLRNLGQTMTNRASVPAFVRGSAEWEERVHDTMAERVRVEAIAFHAGTGNPPSDLRAHYFSDEHRKALADHAERLARLGRIIAKWT